MVATCSVDTRSPAMFRRWTSTLILFLLLLGALPVHAQSLLERLEKRLEDVIPKDGEAKAPKPAVEPGYLGIVGDNLEGTAGVLVVDVKAGTPAADGGLKVGDVITAVDGR